MCGTPVLMESKCELLIRDPLLATQVMDDSCDELVDVARKPDGSIFTSSCPNGNIVTSYTKYDATGRGKTCSATLDKCYTCSSSKVIEDGGGLSSAIQQVIVTPTSSSTTATAPSATGQISIIYSAPIQVNVPPIAAPTITTTSPTTAPKINPTYYSISSPTTAPRTAPTNIILTNPPIMIYLPSNITQTTTATTTQPTKSPVEFIQDETTIPGVRMMNGMSRC
jgi:hypothetical protein